MIYINVGSISLPRNSSNPSYCIYEDRTFTIYKNIKNKMAEDKDKIENMICPKCEGKLVVRNSKYGLFIGCSNYPKCKFTKKR